MTSERSDTEVVREALGLAVSMVRAGEKESPRATEAFEAGLAALALLRAAETGLDEAVRIIRGVERGTLEPDGPTVLEFLDRVEKRTSTESVG